MSGLFLHIIYFAIYATSMLTYPHLFNKIGQDKHTQTRSIAEGFYCGSLDVCDCDSEVEDESEGFYICHQSSVCCKNSFPRITNGLESQYFVRFILFEADTSPPAVI